MFFIEGRPNFVMWPLNRFPIFAKREIESVFFRCTYGKSRTGWIYMGEFKCNLFRYWRFTAWNVHFKGSQSCLEQRNGTSSSITLSFFTILTSQQHTLQWSEIHQKYDISISLTLMIKSRWSPSKHHPKQSDRSLLHKKLSRPVQQKRGPFPHL